MTQEQETSSKNIEALIIIRPRCIMTMPIHSKPNICFTICYRREFLGCFTKRNAKLFLAASSIVLRLFKAPQRLLGKSTHGAMVAVDAWAMGPMEISKSLNKYSLALAAVRAPP